MVGLLYLAVVPNVWVMVLLHRWTLMKTWFMLPCIRRVSAQIDWMYVVVFPCTYSTRYLCFSTFFLHCTWNSAVFYSTYLFSWFVSFYSLLWFNSCVDTITMHNESKYVVQFWTVGWSCVCYIGCLIFKTEGNLYYWHKYACALLNGRRLYKTSICKWIFLLILMTFK